MKTQLLIIQQDLLCKTLQAQLRAADYEVRIIRNGEELCSRSARQADLILLDLAHCTNAPAVMVAALVIPVTGTGRFQVMLVPLPSCPAMLCPQHLAVPLVRVAQV